MNDIWSQYSLIILCKSQNGFILVMQFNFQLACLVPDLVLLSGFHQLAMLSALFCGHLCYNYECSFFYFWGHKSFSWSHLHPCFGLLVMSTLGFKARVDPLYAFSLVWSSDSPLVWHLLTVERSAWQPSLFDPCTYISASIGGSLGWTWAWIHNCLCCMQQARHCKPLGLLCSFCVVIFFKFGIWNN